MFCCCSLNNSSEDGEPAVPQDGRCVRPFTISSKSVAVPESAPLYRDQSLAKTPLNKLPINQEKVKVSEVKVYAAKTRSEHFVDVSMVNEKNAHITKVIQNFYIISFGGVRASIFKRFKINLVFNASIDLPMVVLDNVSVLRVPVSDREPQTLATYIESVADRIQENYQKNGCSLIYDHHGAFYSVALAIGYLLKYTDLLLSEAVQHMRYQRQIFDEANANLGSLTDVVNKFAEKLGKMDSSLKLPDGCEVAASTLAFPSAKGETGNDSSTAVVTKSAANSTSSMPKSNANSATSMPKSSSSMPKSGTNSAASMPKSNANSAAKLAAAAASEEKASSSTATANSAPPEQAESSETRKKPVSSKGKKKKTLSNKEKSKTIKSKKEKSKGKSKSTKKKK